MRISLAAWGGLLLIALASPAAAQTSDYRVTIAPVHPAKGYQKLSVSKAALAGGDPVRLWANTAIDPDCSAHVPGSTLTILEPPAHGAATVSQEPFFAAFPPNNPRSACNSRKVPGNQVFYTAMAGYKGHDKVVLQGTSPNGMIRRIEVGIDVR